MEKEPKGVLADIVKLVGQHREGTASGNHHAANEAYDELERIFDRMIAKGEEAEIARLMEHPSVAVQLWAASRSLEYTEDAATSALRRIAGMWNQYPLESLSAEYVLKEWRSGRLKLRPDAARGNDQEEEKGSGKKRGSGRKSGRGPLSGCDGDGQRR